MARCSARWRTSPARCAPASSRTPSKTRSRACSRGEAVWCGWALTQRERDDEDMVGNCERAVRRRMALGRFFSRPVTGYSIRRMRQGDVVVAYQAKDFEFVRARQGTVFAIEREGF